MSRSTMLAVALMGLVLTHMPAAAQREMLFGPEESDTTIQTKKRNLRQPPITSSTPKSVKPIQTAPPIQEEVTATHTVANQQPSLKLPVLPPLPGAPVAGRREPNSNKPKFSHQPEDVTNKLPHPGEKQTPRVKFAEPSRTQRTMGEVVGKVPEPGRSDQSPSGAQGKHPSANSSGQSSIEHSLNEAPPALRTNPFTQRRRLAKIMPSGPLLGISPGLSNGAGGNYAYDQSYLPLTNYLSGKLGALVVPAYEPDLASLRNSIRDRRYPVVYASTQVSDDLRNAGYRQIVTNDTGVGLAIMVRTGSPMKDVKQLSRHSVAVDLSGPLGSSAIAALEGEGIGTSVRLVDTKGPTLRFVLDRVLEGSVDAGIVNTAQADLAEKKAPGTFRILKAYPVAATDGFWVLPERVDASTASRLARALEAMSYDSEHRDVARRLSFVTQLPVRFKAIYNSTP